MPISKENSVSIEDESYLQALAAEPKMTMDEVGADIDEHGHVPVTEDTSTKDPFTAKGAMAYALDELEDSETALKNPTDDFRDETKGEVEGATSTPQGLIQPVESNKEGEGLEPTIQQDEAVHVKDSLSEALDAITMDGAEEIEAKPPIGKDPVPNYTNYSEETGSHISYKAPDIPTSMGGDEDKPDANGLVYVTATFTVDPDKYISNNYRPASAGKAPDAGAALKKASAAMNRPAANPEEEAALSDLGTPEAKEAANASDEPTEQQEKDAAKAADKEQEQDGQGEEKNAADSAPEAVVLDYATFIDGSSFICFDEVSGIDYSKITMDAGPKKAPTRENCQTTFAQCRAKNPLYCRFHGPKLLEADIRVAIKAACGPGCVVSVTKDKGAPNKFAFRLTVGCPPAKKKMVQDIVDMYMTQQPGISSAQTEMKQIEAKGGKEALTQEFEMDILKSDTPPKKGKSDSLEAVAQGMTEEYKSRNKVMPVVKETPKAIEIAAKAPPKENDTSQNPADIENESDSSDLGEKNLKESDSTGNMPQPNEEGELKEEIVEKTPEEGGTEPPKEAVKKSASWEYVNQQSEKVKAAEKAADSVFPEFSGKLPSLIVRSLDKKLVEAAEGDEGFKEGDAYKAMKEAAAKYLEAGKPIVAQAEELGPFLKAYNGTEEEVDAEIQKDIDMNKTFEEAGKELKAAYEKVLAEIDGGKQSAGGTPNADSEGTASTAPSTVESPNETTAETDAPTQPKYKEPTEQDIATAAKAMAKVSGFSVSAIKKDIANRLNGKKPITKPVMDFVNRALEEKDPVREALQRLYNKGGATEAVATAEKSADTALKGSPSPEIRTTAEKVKEAADKAKEQTRIADELGERLGTMKDSKGGIGEAIAKAAVEQAATKAADNASKAEETATKAAESLQKQMMQSHEDIERRVKGESAAKVEESLTAMAQAIFPPESRSDTVAEEADKVLSDIEAYAKEKGIDNLPQDKPMANVIEQIKKSSDRLDEIMGVFRNAIEATGVDFHDEDIKYLAEDIGGTARKIVQQMGELRKMSESMKGRIDSMSELAKEKEKLQQKSSSEVSAAKEVNMDLETVTADDIAQIMAGYFNRTHEKEQGFTPASADRYKKTAGILLDALKGKDAETLMAIVGFSGNESSDYVFEKVTGMNLPKTNKGRSDTIDAYCGITPEKRSLMREEEKQKAKEAKRESILDKGRRQAENMKILHNGADTTLDTLLHEGWIAGEYMKGNQRKRCLYDRKTNKMVSLSAKDKELWEYLVNESEKMKKEKSGNTEEVGKSTQTDSTGTKSRIAKVYEDWVGEDIPDWVSTLSADDAETYADLLEKASSWNVEEEGENTALKALEEFESKFNTKAEETKEEEKKEETAKAAESHKEIVAATKRLGVDAYKPVADLKEILQQTKAHADGNPRLEQKVKDIEAVLADREAKKNQAPREGGRYVGDEMPEEDKVNLVAQLVAEALEG